MHESMILTRGLQAWPGPQRFLVSERLSQLGNGWRGRSPFRAVAAFHRVSYIADNAISHQ